MLSVALSSERNLSPASCIVLATGAVLLLLLVVTFYNAYLHPLARFPGPKIWAATRLTFIQSLFKGSLIQDVQKLHDEYGDTVRIAPNEVSMTNPAAWRDIYTNSGQKAFPKNPVWWHRRNNEVDTIMNANDIDHSRMRRLFGHEFSDRTLKAQEPRMQSYIDLLVRNLKEAISEGDDVQDIVHWYTYTAFDIISELALSESFGCLDQKRAHPWVDIISSQFKAMAFISSSRFFVPVLLYSIIESLVTMCAPRSAIEKKTVHATMTKEKVTRRLKHGSKPEDYISHILKDRKGLSEKEIECTFNVLMVAGSESVSTALSGLTNYLVKDQRAFKLLAAEIRGQFEHEADISLASVSKLQYLRAVIDEGLRMSSPTPVGSPRVVPPSGASVCGQWLPGNTNITFHQLSANKSCSNFARPNEFLPERWLPSSPFPNDNKAAFQPFSIGPRSCIGKSLAYAEMRLILARLVWNFDLELPGSSEESLDWASQKSYVMIEKEPFYVRLGFARGRGDGSGDA